MKGILRFDLPEENNEFMLAKKGSEWANVLYTVDKRLRDWLKYGFPPTPSPFESVRDTLESVRVCIHEEMQASNLTFDDLN